MEPTNEEGDLFNAIEEERERQKHLAAQLIYGENPQATPEEAALMIDSVRNRAHKQGKTIDEVLNQHNEKGQYQYETFDPAYVRRADVDSFGPDHPMYGDIRAMVDAAFDPKRKPSGVTHYYATKKHKPYWASALADVIQAGAHTFGREVPLPTAAYRKK